MSASNSRVAKIEAVGLFDAYYRVMDRHPPAGWDAGIAHEGRKRLRQLDWLLIEVQRRELEHSAAMMAEEHRAAFRASDEIELLAECFYYVAFRAQRLIASLPELGGFEAIGVRDVRNHLIEHPERKDSGVVNRGFQFGADRGPVLRAVRLDTDPKDWQDPGLYANAMEFRNKLVSLLLPYLSRDFDETQPANSPETS
jgi:hypothetical protein